MSYSRCSHHQRRARRLGAPVQELPRAYKFPSHVIARRNAPWQSRAGPPILYPLTHPVCLSRKLKPRPAKHPALFPHGCDQLRKQPHLLRRQPLCVQKLRRLICLSSQQIIRTAPVKIRQREQILRAGCTLSRLIARNDRRGNTQSIRNLPLRIAAADPQIPQALR